MVPKRRRDAADAHENFLLGRIFDRSRVLFFRAFELAFDIMRNGCAPPRGMKYRRSCDTAEGDEEGFKRPTVLSLYAAPACLPPSACATRIHVSVMDSIRQETENQGGTGEWGTA